MKLVSSCNGPAKHQLCVTSSSSHTSMNFTVDATVTYLLSQLLQLRKQVLSHTRDQAPLHENDNLTIKTLQYMPAWMRC